MSWLTNIVKNNPYYKAAPQGTLGTDVASTAAGVAGLAGNVAGIANSNQKVGMEDPQGQKDAYGRPIYNLGGFSQQVNNLEPKGASGGQFMSGVASGASAGAPFAAATGGLSVLGGALIGGVGSLIGGAIKKNKEEKTLEENKKKLTTLQNNFNSQNISANNNLLAQQAYEDQLNMYKLPKTFL